MARYIIQSLTTGRFLCPDLDGGEPCWNASLRESGGGVMTDLDQVQQLFTDCCDFDDGATVIDLDRLGTVNDYPIKQAKYEFSI